MVYLESKKIESYAVFTLHESISKVKTWKEDRFLPPSANQDDHVHSYVCLRSNNAIELTFEQLDHNQKNGTKVIVKISALCKAADLADGEVR